MFTTSWSQVWETLQVFQSRAAPGCLLTQDEHVRTRTSRLVSGLGTTDFSYLKSFIT